MFDSFSHLLSHFNFVSHFPPSSEILSVKYNYILVILSYVIASIAGYTGLNISRLIHDRENLNIHSTRLLILGSISMGLGIWAMHFIAMLAYSINVEIYYNITITIISVFPAIFASWVTLSTMSHSEPTFRRLIFQGLIIGLGIGVMHYIGMGAMIQDAIPGYHIATFIFSILIAWVLGVFTLYICFSSYVKQYFSKFNTNIITAAIWGASVSGMHYTGMAAAFFTEGDGMAAQGIASNSLIIPVAVISLTLILASLVFSQFQEKLLSINIEAQAHRDRMLEVIDEMSDGFIVTDKDNAIKIYNKQMHTIIPGSSESLKVGNPIEFFLIWLTNNQTSDDMDDDELKKFISYFQAIQSCKSSIEIHLTDDRWILLRQSKNKLGDVTRIWTDITANKKSDESLFQEDKMDSMGRMVAGVAHEVNTPLSICLTLASELENESQTIRDKHTNDEVSQSEFENYLKSTENISELFLTNIRRAASLIRNFKQVAVDQSHLEKEKIRLKNYTEQIIYTLHSEYKSLNPDIKVTGPDEYELTTTPGAYSQVIINLIKNSLLHAFEKTTSPAISIDIAPKPDHVIIEYRDNGSGMNKEILSKIFDPFFTTKRHNGGTGLGMHIVFNIVTQKLKGNISVESKPNMGSCFTISIPSH